MKIESLKYAADVEMHGYLAFEEGLGKKPAVIVAHAWRGQDEFAREKAKALANLGYVGFAVDLYGDGLTAESDEQAAALMKPLFIDRQKLRARMVAAFSALQKHPSVDKDNIAAIGFCFGGLSVIELLRSGQAIKGVASFHGLLGHALGDMEAKKAPLQSSIKGSLLLLHGYHDPLVSSEDLTNIQKEFSEAGVDWQLYIYGNALHAFSNPQANDLENGLVYNSDASRRSWQAMKNFLTELFSPEGIL